MPRKPAPHPLEVWLAQKGLKAYLFARKHKIGERQIYAHIRGEVQHPGLKAMEAIEKATKGAVTVDAQIRWAKRNRLKVAAREPADGDAEDGPEPDGAEEPDQPIDEDMIDEPFGDEP